jgi:hypothetical protein
VFHVFAFFDTVDDDAHHGEKVEENDADADQSLRGGMHGVVDEFGNHAGLLVFLLTVKRILPTVKELRWT